MAVRAACRALLAVKSWILPETGLCRELTALLRFTVSCTGVPFGSSSGVSPSWGKGFRGVRAPRNRKGRGEPPFRLSDDAYCVPKVLLHPVGTVVLCHNQRCSKDLHAENFLPPPSDPGRIPAAHRPGQRRAIVDVTNSRRWTRSRRSATDRLGTPMPCWRASRKRSYRL